MRDAALPDGLDGRYWLTDAMARGAGVRLPDAVATGQLSRPDLGEMVARCGACTKTDTCLLHLAEGAETVPGFCLNNEVIEALRSR